MASELERITQIEIQLALTDLNTSFCHYLDHGETDLLVNLFTENAHYSHGPRHSRSREEIRTLFEERASAGVRTSRHVYSGLKLEILSNREARGRSVCMTFAENVPPPVSNAHPYLVADFIDEYYLCDDGRWRISKRHIERIFVAENNKAPQGYPGNNDNN